MSAPLSAPPARISPVSSLVGAWTYCYLDGAVVPCVITHEVLPEVDPDPRTGLPFLQGAERSPRCYVEATAFPRGQAPRPVAFDLEEHAQIPQVRALLDQLPQVAKPRAKPKAK